MACFSFIHFWLKAVGRGVFFWTSYSTFYKFCVIVTMRNNCKKVFLPNSWFTWHLRSPWHWGTASAVWQWVHGKAASITWGNSISSCKWGSAKVVAFQDYQEQLDLKRHLKAESWQSFPFFYHTVRFCNPVCLFKGVIQGSLLLLLEWPGFLWFTDFLSQYPFHELSVSFLVF